MLFSTVGLIKRFAFPVGRRIDAMVPCEGQVYSVADWYVLFAVIGNAYGGSPSAGTFAVPKLANEYIVAAGNYPSGDWGVSLGAVSRFGMPIVPGDGSSATAGSVAFLPCNGTLASATTYSKLFGLIGSAYGSASGQFRVPTLADPPYHGICYDAEGTLPDGDDLYIGQVLLLPTQAAAQVQVSDGVLLECNGQVVSFPNHLELYSLIGNIYGGDPRTSFAVPTLPPPGNLALTHKFYVVAEGVFPDED